MIVVVEPDPIGLVTAWMADKITAVPDLAGFAFGTRMPSSGKPVGKFVRFDLVGGGEDTRVSSRAEVRVQVWMRGPDKERNRVANILAAHLRASFVGHRSAGPVEMPDPVEPGQMITQFTMSLLLIGQHR